MIGIRNPPSFYPLARGVRKAKKEPVSPGDFNAWQQESRVFQGLAAYKQWEFRTLTGAGDPDEVWASPVPSNLFRLLGLGAAIGRTFAPDESQAIVLSHEYWRSHFASDRNILGKSVSLDRKPNTVIGVAPADLEFPSPDTQIWVPLTFSAGEKNDHEHHSLIVIARLKAGITPNQAQAEMELLAHRLAMQYPETNLG